MNEAQSKRLKLLAIADFYYDSGVIGNIKAIDDELIEMGYARLESSEGEPLHEFHPYFIVITPEGKNALVEVLS
jgi:hypothetical protein